MNVYDTIITREREYVSQFEPTEDMTDSEVDKLFDYYAEAAE